MDYSPFNLVVWIVFAGFIAITYFSVRAFHAKYPNYPNEEKKAQK